MKVEKGVVKVGRGYNNMDHMNKNFKFHTILKAISRLLSLSSAPSFKQYWNY